MTYPVHGAGLGLRRALLGPLTDRFPDSVSFLEVAPENWMHIGGAHGRQFRALTEEHNFVCHGLSLSLGGPAPLDEDFVRDIKRFLDAHRIRYYTEHLSYCSDDGHLYDLMPIPFTAEAVEYVAARIRRVQDILERPIAVENVSYYAAPGAEHADAPEELGGRARRQDELVGEGVDRPLDAEPAVPGEAETPDVGDAGAARVVRDDHRRRRWNMFHPARVQLEISARAEEAAGEPEHAHHRIRIVRPRIARTVGSAVAAA